MTAKLRNKFVAILHAAAITGTLLFSSFHVKAADIPTLDDMAADWMPASIMLNFKTVF